MAMLNTFQHTSLREFEGAESKRVFKQQEVEFYEGIKARYTDTRKAMTTGIEAALQTAMWNDHRQMAQYLRNADMQVQNPAYHD
jgi:hypothetical protein